jgi:N-acetylneuraminic acid mutarotase
LRPRCCCGKAQSQRRTRTAAPALQQGRAAHAVVANGDAVYALAGTGAGGRPVLEVERFDGSRWQDESVLPGHGLNAPAAAALGGEIFLIGGFDLTSNVPTAEVSAYDTRKQRWRPVAALPSARGGHAAAVIGGRIHVVGGGNSERTLADHSVYDPTTNRWRELAPLPRSEGSPALVAWDGKLYAIGGRSGPSDFGEVYIYDPARDAWSNGPPIEPRGTAGAAVHCGAILLFGGESQAKGTTLASVLRLAPGAKAWEDGPAMPTARSFARAVPYRDAIYVVGGSTVAGNSHASAGSAVVERYSAHCTG